MHDAVNLSSDGNGTFLVTVPEVRTYGDGREDAQESKAKGRDAVVSPALFVARSSSIARCASRASARPR